MRGVQLLAMIGFLIAFWETKPLDFLGLEQLRPGQKSDPDSLRITGMYCRMRHPLYTFGILFIWMTPTMTVNGLVIFFFTTLYLYIGSIHEESRLVTEFGTAYEDYQQHVPRLIPRPGRCYQPTTLS